MSIRTRTPAALQAPRVEGMDLTPWLEYYVEGVATEMREVQQLAEETMRRKLILFEARAAGVKERPLRILAFLLERGGATVREAEVALAENRTALQRCLKLLVDQGLVRELRIPHTNARRYEPVPIDV